MKKLLLMLTAAVMSLTATVTAQDFTVGDFTYSLIKSGYSDEIGGLRIVGYNGGTDVVIPDEVTIPDESEPRKVLKIDASIFQGNTTITSVKLSANIIRIEAKTFAGCTSLETVDTKGCTALKELKNYAFQNCTSLVSFEVPEKLNGIGTFCFDGCSKLENVTFAGNSWTGSTSTSNQFSNCTSLASIVLPESVINLPNSIFKGCTSLSSVKFPSGMQTIGNNAFESCTSLKEIDLTDTEIKTIGATAFKNASALETIKLPIAVTLISGDAFNGTAVTSVISSDTPVEGGVNIPLVITDLYASFKDCLKLLNVDLYNSNITTITNSAFSGSTAVETFKFPKNLNLDQYTSTSASINSPLFNGMTALREVTLPDNTEVNIPTALFKGATSLETVVMPEGAKVISIGLNAFNGCAKFNPDSYITNDLVSIGNSGLSGTAITKFTYTSSLTTLGQSALNGCTQLISVDSEDGCKVAAVEKNTFNKCSNLKSITLPQSIREVESSCFANCGNLVKLDMGATQLVTTLPTGYTTSNILSNSRNLESVSLPKTLEEIGAQTFLSQKYLTSIELPASLKTIGNEAFNNCDVLETVNFPENLVTIGNNAFNGCKKITSVNFPIGLESIGNNAFKSVPLEDSLIIPGTVRTIGSDAFNGNHLSTIVICVPEDENENTRAAEATISIGSRAFFSSVSPSRLESVYSFYTTPPEITADVFYKSTNQSQIDQYKAKLYVPTPELYKVAAGWENFTDNNIVTGVGDVETDAEQVFDVYNLQGVRVAKTTDRNLSDLPQGIYIVNGKKVVKN